MDEFSVVYSLATVFANKLIQQGISLSVTGSYQANLPV